MTYHVYRNRHVFHDDEHVGKYDTQTKVVRLREEFGNHAEAVKAHFMRTKGLFVKVLTGEESLPAPVPLVEFPESVREQMDAGLGDMSPACIQHALANFSREEFERRYRGRVEYLPASGGTMIESTGDAPPAWDGPDGQTHTIFDVIAACSDKQELETIAREHGLELDRRKKLETLRAELTAHLTNRNPDPETE